MNSNDFLVVRHGLVVITTAQLHSAKPKLIEHDSNQVQIVLVAYWRFTMVRISDNGPN